MVQWMGVVNLTPDSFFEPSRADSSNPAAVLERIRSFVDAGASIIDLGAVSTRPGAAPVTVEEEWGRLVPVLRELHRLAPSAAAGSAAVAGSAAAAGSAGPLPITISIDTTSAEIVRRVYDTIGPFIVNDISAGEDDSLMLQTVGKLGLTYVAMHKRGTPQTMDAMVDYPGGVVRELVAYFDVFSRLAESYGISDWILDPGLGFAKTDKQNWEILRKLRVLTRFGRPVLIGAADKRFTRSVPHWAMKWCLANRGKEESGTDIANAIAVVNGASILRVHEIPK